MKKKVGPFTWIYDVKNRKFVRKYKRKGLHGYPRTVPEKYVSKLLNDTKILHPTIYRKRIKYIDEEFIESNKDIKEVNKEDIMEIVIFNITEMYNINCKKIKKFIKWRNNSEYLKFQIENLKKVLVDRKCKNIEDNIKKLEEMIKKLDDDRKLVLIHGDIHTKNMIYTNEGIYFIDWEMATCGDIAYELAMYFILMQYNEIEKQNFYDKLCEKISINKQNLIKDIKTYENFEIFRQKILKEIRHEKNNKFC